MNILSDSPGKRLALRFWRSVSGEYLAGAARVCDQDTHLEKHIAAEKSSWTCWPYMWRLLSTETRFNTETTERRTVKICRGYPIEWSECVIEIWIVNLANCNQIRIKQPESLLGRTESALSAFSRCNRQGTHASCESDSCSLNSVKRIERPE